VFTGTARFRCLELLGKGSLGLVYRVYDEEMRQEVALKTLPDLMAEDIYYIKEEFRALKHIRHTNLVELHELIVDSNHCFFTMELVDGLPFTEYVWGQDGRTSARRLSSAGLARLRSALPGLAAGLAALHREGKLHRDVKPLNVLVTPQGRVVLLDFDMVTHFGPESLRGADQNHSVGTPHYVSPEQFWNKPPLSPATDWYSVGVLLFEVLAGELPPIQEILRSKQRGTFPGLDALTSIAPADIQVLVRSLLDFNPERRMGELDVQRAAYGVAAAPEPEDAVNRTAAGTPFVGRAREMGCAALDLPGDALRHSVDCVRRGRIRARQE
jgi:serine/threonine protein kinase